VADETRQRGVDREFTLRAVSERVHRLTDSLGASQCLPDVFIEPSVRPTSATISWPLIEPLCLAQFQTPGSFVHSLLLSVSLPVVPSDHLPTENCQSRSLAGPVNNCLALDDEC